MNKLNEYKGSFISNIRYNPKTKLVYACLYASNGDLLISSTIDYIVEALKERLLNNE